MQNCIDQSAYGYYNTTVVELSAQKTVTSKAKRLVAAALISSNSIMVLGGPACAATNCTPATTNGAITGSVVGGGTFISQAVDRHELSYGLGVGMTYEMDEQLSIRFLYDGEYQEDYQEHSLSAAVRLQF